MNIVADDLINYHCPRYNELPEIDLYIDQVVTILQNNLAIFCKDPENPIITPSMINNYVKHGLVSSPIKKRYNKEHLAHLFVICILKKILSISDINESLRLIKKLYSVEDGYNIFCDELEYSLKSAFDKNYTKKNDILDSDIREISTLKAITSAFANCILVDRLISMREK